MSVPYRAQIASEYVGEREKAYERELEQKSVVAIWGEPGVGKTWVGARLAIQWETRGFSFSPYSGVLRQAFWFECREGMDFYELIFALNQYLRGQGEMSLWHWLRSSPERSHSPSEVISRLTELLNREQYLLCLDDFHFVDNDQDVRSLLRELARTLNGSATKVVLIGRREPGIQGGGGRELQVMDRAGVQDLVLTLGGPKEWLDETIALQFADRLADLVGLDLKLVDVITNDWLKSHVTRAGAEAYLEALDGARIAELIFERGDQDQATLLTILSILDDWEGRSTLIELACREGIEEHTCDRALDALLEAKLVQEDEERYLLHASVRKLCHARQVQRQEDLSGLHQRVADVFADRGDLISAVNHYLKVEAFSKAIQLLADNMIEITRTGKAQAALNYVLALQDVAKRSLDERESLWIYILMSDLYAWLGKLGFARFAAQDGLELLAGFPSKDDAEIGYLEGRLRARLGTVLWHSQQFSEAIDHLIASEDLMRDYVKSGGARLRASRAHEWLRVLHNLGLVYRARAVNQKGEDRAASFRQAIAYYEELINRSALYGRNERMMFFAAFALVGLGQVYDDRDEEGDRAAKIETVQRGLQKFEEIDHQWGIGFANRTLGEIYFRQGDYEKAIQFRRRGLEAAYKYDDKQAIILTNATLAEIHIVKLDLTTAHTYLAAAKEVLAEAPIPFLWEFVSFLERWAEGLDLLQKGRSMEGERILHGVLKEFWTKGSDYAAEASLVEENLKAFGCSVPEPVEAPPAPAPAPPTPSTDRVGRYQLQAELGKGNMGTVHQAYDPNIGRSVALKVLRSMPEPHAEELARRFRREARAAGRLQHPNIVMVYDADVVDGQWYIVMEHLAGRTLREIIAKDGPQPLEWVADIVVQVCKALDYAHEQQVIHRDIKPSNIVVLEDSRVKVTDFGLASIAIDPTITQDGALVGTVCYMSPEQLREPTQVDGRSDIFSLAAVIYELLTGERVFPAESHTLVYRLNHPDEPVDLSGLNQGWQPIHLVLERALSADADERFSTCLEFSKAFVAAVQGQIYNTAAIRNLLCDAFSYPDLMIFCHDHFPAVRRMFSDTMSLEQMAQRLLEYCERYLLLDQLLTLIKQANPAQYGLYESRLRRSV